MKVISAAEIRQSLDWISTIQVLEQAFIQDSRMPTRHHHVMADGPEPPVHLLMPAWIPNKYLGVKAVNVFPANAKIGKPAVSGVYLLFSGETGETLAILEGGELTARRTAAASALAARYLARQDASRLLIVGTGRLSRQLAFAHSAVRPIKSVSVWGRTPEKAEQAAREMRQAGLQARAVTDLEAAVGAADIVSCATLSTRPLVRGAWLKPGTHLDLVGGFTPSMRETDDDAIRCCEIFVDTRAGATKEAGDIVVPLQTSVLSADGIRADLFDLTRRTHPGRTSDSQITLFKSVGVAIEDLAAASLVYEKSVDCRAIA
ncbi:ornithine cyclodeaminase family protein [Ferrovibrio sp.]|uniref:ornithine cyclodeaminase family protein n=1 Tax=Ferrovibrio sp. TaxID=1917215 RepID=UPI0035B32BBB